MSRFQKYLENEKPIVTLEDVLSTYKKRNAAEGIINFLEDRGLLPLTYLSPLLPEINILVSWVMWSGSVGNKSAKNFQPKVNISIPMQYREDLEGITARLGVNLAHGEAVSTLGRNGAAYARLLSSIGGLFYSAGSKEMPDTKSKREVGFPYYLDFLMKHYRHIHGKEKQIATKLLADNLRVLLKTRMSRMNALSYSLHLFENESRDVVQSFAHHVIDLFNIVYPNVGLSYSSVRVYSKLGEKKRFRAKISFNTENVLAATKHYMLFKIILSPGYHEFGDRLSKKRRRSSY